MFEITTTVVKNMINKQHEAKKLISDNYLVFGKLSGSPLGMWSIEGNRNHQELKGK